MQRSWLSAAVRCVGRMLSAARLPPSPDAAAGFSFTNIARAAGLDARIVFGGQATNKYLLETTGTGVALIDYDNDGRLDLFFVNGSTLEGFPADRAPSNHLYRNTGTGSFEDVTQKLGLAASGWGQGACVGDYDNDGNDDLFVTYWGQNRLYHNTGQGKFVDVTREAGLSAIARALEHRLRLPRLRSRRPPRSRCCQLHRSRSENRSHAGVRPLPIQRSAGGLRTSGADGWQERAVPQSRRRRL